MVINMKLIASDLDGTLLQNGSMQVSDRTIKLIAQLTKNGYLFVAASGRQ
jgi:hydroxymethylpyrimidine pyrophosphatase-like HAD family hydrolase